MKLILIFLISLNLFAINLNDYEEFYGGKYNIQDQDLHRLLITPTEEGYLTITTYMAPYCDVKVFNSKNRLISNLNILNGYKIEVKVKAEKDYLIWITPKNKNCKYVLINYP